jgi:hypothetical protein
VGQQDVAADAPPAGLLRPAVGRFHQPGSAASNHGETGTGQPAADLAAQLVLRRPRAEPRRAEDGDRRPEAVKLPEAPLKLFVDPQEPLALTVRGPGLRQELAFLDVAGILTLDLAQLVIQGAST